MATNLLAHCGRVPRDRPAERLNVEINKLNTFIYGRNLCQIHVVAVSRAQHAESGRRRGASFFQ